MEDVQSWWEVPAITHFCSVFRATFNLIYFDVEELEAAILNMQDPEMSISLDQLILKLLEGCFDEGEVRNFNWEEKLKELFDEHLEDEDNILREMSFESLAPRLKVEVLFKLCHIRLDVAAAEDLIKDIPAENMQAKCLGQDSEKYSYWYFSDERLYKESPNASKQNSLAKKKKTESIPVKNGRRQGARNVKPTVVPPSDIPWSIVCYNLSDWEKLAQKFSKSKNASEKELAKEIKTHYLEDITKIINEKERLLRKRLLEMAPKRTSSRICKVQAQRKLEEQMAAEAEEDRRKERERESAKQAAMKKIQEKEDRRKRAEERSKIVEERAKRVQQRGMLKNFVGDYQDSEDSKDSLQNSNCEQKSESGESSSESGEEESEDESEEESDQSGSEESESNENDDDEESDCDTDSTDSKSYIQRDIDVIHTYDLTEWNSTIDTKGKKLHVLQTASSDDASRKRFRINEAGSYKVSSLNGLHSVTQKENHNRQSYHIPTNNSISNIAPQHYIKKHFL